jgi:hypothetical protein
VHVRGFEPPKPRGVAVLRTAAANRICLTCQSWRRERGFEPATPEGALAFRASAIDLTRPSLQTWRRLEDDFRTLVASGFEFPDVTFSPLEAGKRVENSTGSADSSTDSEHRLSDASDRTGSSSGGQFHGRNQDAVRGVAPAVPSPAFTARKDMQSKGSDSNHPGDSAAHLDFQTIQKSENPEINSGTCEKLPRESSPEGSSFLASATPLIKVPLQVSRILMNRHDRVRIYQLVWSIPMDKAGKILGIGQSIRRVCEDLYIPHPGKGYWSKKASNKPIAPPPPLLPVQVRETGKIVEGADNIVLVPETVGEAEPAKCAVVRLPNQSHLEGHETPERFGASSQSVAGEKACNTGNASVHRDDVELPQGGETQRTRDLLEQPQLALERGLCSKEDLPKVPASLMARHDRQGLYEKVWISPMRDVAKTYGLSDVGLAKTCRKLFVPVPPPGYWNQIAAGKKVITPPPLPQVQITNKRATRRAYRPHREKEQTSILDSIARDISMGETIIEACRRAEISESTYYRWQKEESACPDVLRCKPAQLEAQDLSSDLSIAHEAGNHRSTKVYSLGEVAAISERIFHAVRGGGTIAEACFGEGISERTYRDWKKRAEDPAYPLWNALNILNSIERGVRRRKSRPGRRHSVEQIALIRQQIVEAVAAGKTILEACRTAEIDVATYHRWLKRCPDILANSRTTGKQG